MNNLASLLLNKEDYAAAAPLLRRSLEGKERALGADHPDTLITLMSQAALFVHLGRQGDAEVLYRRAMRGFENAYGKQHPYTQAASDDLQALIDRRRRRT